MMRRPDRVAEPPSTWEEVEAIARRRPVAQSLAGPHAILSVMSMSAAQGVLAGGEDFLPEDTFADVFGVMKRLWSLRPLGSERLNPIALSEAMARDDLALVPLVFGYVTYARAQADRQALAFSDVIGGRGGVLGGTGIGVTRRCETSPDLLNHLTWLMSRAAQVDLLPTFGGQPSARAAWQDEGVNEAWGGFYQSTLATAEKAYLRPRFDGYIAFQTAASALLREALAAGEDDVTTLKALRGLWRDARGRARGDLDDRRPT
jgi:multiple sugar transport system substrate-binding protein